MHFLRVRCRVVRATRGEWDLYGCCTDRHAYLRYSGFARRLSCSARTNKCEFCRPRYGSL